MPLMLLPLIRLLSRARLTCLAGLRASDLRVWRSGTTTHLAGARSVPYLAAGVDVLRAERRYGPFRVAVEVPEAYHSRWDSCGVRHGVLRVKWRRDVDEEDLSPS